jgi:hypothetical protein
MRPDYAVGRTDLAAPTSPDAGIAIGVLGGSGGGWDFALGGTGTFDRQ